MCLRYSFFCSLQEYLQAYLYLIDFCLFHFFCLLHRSAALLDFHQLVFIYLSRYIYLSIYIYKRQEGDGGVLPPAPTFSLYIFVCRFLVEWWFLLLRRRRRRLQPPLGTAGRRVRASFFLFCALGEVATEGGSDAAELKRRVDF